jgi:hypothetical protein
MKRLMLMCGLALACLAGCSASQDAAVTKALASPAGQLFCSIQTNGGGSFVAGLTATALTGVAAPGTPLFVMATDAGKAAVDADCAKAAQVASGGVSGIPVSPPASPVNVPQLAIVAPASPVVSGAKPTT